MLLHSTSLLQSSRICSLQKCPNKHFSFAISTAVSFAENAQRCLFSSRCPQSEKNCQFWQNSRREITEKHQQFKNTKKTGIKKMSADSETGTKQFLRNSKLDCRVHDNMPYACTRSFNRFLNLALACSFRKHEINHLCADFATAVECCIITKSTLAALSRFGPRCQ